jgi:ABC-2 type transport system ATP-binding protein
LAHPGTLNMTALRFSTLHKAYGRSPVLRGVEFEVQPGRIFGLAGVNGAGKTTLIKCLLDFCTPSCGSIEIFGVDATQTRAREALAYLPERFVPPWYLDGEAFLRYALGLYNAPYDVARVKATLNELDLDLDALHRPVRQYSKGMTQKLGLAACVLSNKPLMVLDEPMSGLDPKARARLKVLLRRLRDEGRTLFFSTHALADIDDIGDELAILEGGTIHFTGTPAQCRERFQAQTLEQAFLQCCTPATAETTEAVSA